MIGRVLYPKTIIQSGTNAQQDTQSLTKLLT